jgi:hypothetical protein
MSVLSAAVRGAGYSNPRASFRSPSEVPADVKQGNIRVNQEKAREREAEGKKQKVAAIAAVVYGAVVFGQCRIPPHSQPLRSGSTGYAAAYPHNHAA